MLRRSVQKNSLGQDVMLQLSLRCLKTIFHKARAHSLVDSAKKSWTPPLRLMVMDFYFYLRTWAFEFGQVTHSKFLPHGCNRS